MANSGISQIGHANAPVAFYLPNPPIMTTHNQVDCQQIIVDNGNHWRKILTIMAKLTSRTQDWRHYRDHDLLQANELICFNRHYIPSARLHILCGKARWEAFAIDPSTCNMISNQPAAYQANNTLLLPYLDYRQCPNALVERVRPIVQQAIWTT